MPLELDVVAFANLTATRPSSLCVPWGELAERLTRHEERGERDGPGWSPALYREGAVTRSNANVEAVSALVLDVDHAEPEWELLAGLAYCAHSSHKHFSGHADCGGRPDCPHWRVTVPLAAPVAAGDWPVFWAHATAALCPNADPAAKDPSRFFWLPAHPPGAPCDTRRQDGAALDPARIVPDEPPEPDGSDEAEVKSRRERPGDRFNAEATWATILEPHGWQRVPYGGDGERWRRPGKTEGISATANGGGYRLLYVFTSNAPPFEANRSYSRFSAYATLEHGGDYTAAARELGAHYRRNGGGSGPRHDSRRYTSGSLGDSFPGAQDGPGSDDGRVEFTVGTFSVRRMRERDIRAHQWAHTGYFRVGALNATIGVGGAGKGAFIAREGAGWTRGTIPGCFYGRPVKVLTIGDEDDADSDLTPRLMAAGGDTSMARYLSYDQGGGLDLARDLEALSEIIVRGEFRVVYFDAILDHLDGDVNANSPHDVRRALAPLRALARRHELAAIYTIHPNKMSGPASIRDRGGASGQFTDTARSAVYVGYHPDRDGWRALARGKGNAGAVPAALCFQIEGVPVPNPVTGEIVDAPRVANLEEDTTGLTAEMILPHPPRRQEHEETAHEKTWRLAQLLGADGEWRPRSELASAAATEGVTGSAFSSVFNALPGIERDTSSRETIWRVLA